LIHRHRWLLKRRRQQAVTRPNPRLLTRKRRQGNGPLHHDDWRQ
jgi:hypothetical protein